MKERGLLVIEHINMVDPTFVQNRRNSVFNRPKLDANVASTGAAEAHDGIPIAAFFGPDLRILFVHQYLRPQQKKIAVVAGADIKFRVYFVYHTLHRHSQQRDDIDRYAMEYKILQPLPLMPDSCNIQSARAQKQCPPDNQTLQVMSLPLILYPSGNVCWPCKLCVPIAVAFSFTMPCTIREFVGNLQLLRKG